MIAAGLVTGAVASGLLVYAVLFAEGAWRFAQAEAHYRDIDDAGARTVVELDALTRALRASPARRDLTHAAEVQIRAAEQLGVSSFRAITRLSAAQRDLHTGLAASPADVSAWTRLAETEARLGNRRQAVAALMLACRMAPPTPALAGIQMDLAVVLWPNLTTGAKAAVEHRLAWMENRPEMKAVAQGTAAMTIRARLHGERSDP